MVEVRKRGRGPRIAYKTAIALFPFEWDELAMEAKTRGITGAELIGAILSNYIGSMQPPDLGDPGEEVPPDA